MPKYLLFQRDRKTKELDNFSFQGHSDEISVEELKKNISRWNRNKNNKTTYELCENENMIHKCEYVFYNHSISEITDILLEIEYSIEETQAKIRRLRDEYLSLKGMEE
jgi:hypothetical protein